RADLERSGQGQKRGSLRSFGLGHDQRRGVQLQVHRDVFVGGRFGSPRNQREVRQGVRANGRRRADRDRRFPVGESGGQGNGSEPQQAPRDGPQIDEHG